jgi:predicted transcriptional regulator
MSDDLTERIEQLEAKVRELKKAFEQLESRTTKILKLRKLRDEPKKST